VAAAHDDILRDEIGRSHYLGFIVQRHGFTVYHSGDTLWHEELLPALLEYQPDIVLVPINGNKPERRVAGNLNGTEAAALAKACGAKLAVPHHFDMFELTRSHRTNSSRLVRASIGRTACCAAVSGSAMLYRDACFTLLCLCFTVSGGKFRWNRCRSVLLCSLSTRAHSLLQILPSRPWMRRRVGDVADEADPLDVGACHVASGHPLGHVGEPFLALFSRAESTSHAPSP